MNASEIILLVSLIVGQFLSVLCIATTNRRIELLRNKQEKLETENEKLLKQIQNLKGNQRKYTKKHNLGGIKYGAYHKYMDEEYKKYMDIINKHDKKYMDSINKHDKKYNETKEIE